VIYSHLKELNYACLPQIIQKGNKLNELSDLEALWEAGELPKPLNQVIKKDNLPDICNFIFFNP
jgi:hypothetical protein